MEHIQHLLPWSTAGTERRLSVFRFGSGPRKAYIQAALHADELPGMRVAVELKQRLLELEQQGRLNGVIELVPVANPIGLGQMFQATHQGRFDLASGQNFNRDFPALAELVAPQLEGVGDEHQPEHKGAGQVDPATHAVDEGQQRRGEEGCGPFRQVAHDHGNAVALLYTQ